MLFMNMLNKSGSRPELCAIPFNIAFHTLLPFEIYFNSLKPVT